MTQTPYYDFDKSGNLFVVKGSRRVTCGLEYLSEKKVSEYSEGKYKKAGWLLSDSVSPPIHYGTDDLGTSGVLNPVDGKRYDSKAAYYKAVKDAGCIIMGDDAPTQAKQPKTKDIDWKRAVADTVKSISPTKKGKK